jgi:hypothetical protein
MPVGRRPPCVKTPRSGAAAFASIAATMHWLPNFSAASRRIRARHGGGVDRYLVGAGQQQFADVPTVRTPPPTVNGMKHRSAAAHDIVQRRASWLAVMSRKHSCRPSRS